MVAMFGWIIPDPLAMPPMRTGRSPIFISRAIVLVTRSVVTIDRDASSEPVSLNASTALGMPDLSASIRIRWPITPVEACRMSSGAILSALAKISALSIASAHPCFPVLALAWPALHKIARA